MECDLVLVEEWKENLGNPKTERQQLSRAAFRAELWKIPHASIESGHLIGHDGVSGSIH